MQLCIRPFLHTTEITKKSSNFFSHWIVEMFVICPSATSDRNYQVHEVC